MVACRHPRGPPGATPTARGGAGRTLHPVPPLVEENVRPVRVSLALLLAFAASGSFAGVARAESDSGLLNCDENVPICAEPYDSISYEGNYIGHDEPSVLFYDNRPGSGSSATYRVTIPKDP